MKRLLALSLMACHPVLCAFSGYILFQTVPSKAGSSPTSPYSLLISGTFPGFATVANGGHVVNTVSCGTNSIVCPADLVFTADSGCSAPLAGWDITSYSPSTGQLTASVAIPTLSNSRAVKIYACVGNSLITTFQGGFRGAAYDNNYLLALHMDETSGTILHDSTANANDATKKAAGNPAYTASGQVGAAQKFLGTANSSNNDYALFQSLTPATATWTVEFWSDATNYVNADSVFLRNSSVLPIVFLGYYWYPAGSLKYFNSYNSATPTPPSLVSPGVFHYVVFARNADSMNVFVDGVAGTPVTGFGTSPDQFKGLGWDGGPGGPNSFNGILDEVYYSNVTRSSDYITARFNNLSSPSTFYTVGPYTTASVSSRSTTRANSQIGLFVF